MSLITERLHEKRLKDYNINIKAIYKEDTKLLERNTDNSKNDNITKGVCLEKDYYINNELSHKLYNFDPRIEYSFVFEIDKDTIKCPNCGYVDDVKNFNDGCPYCRSFYNMDYTEKNLGTKYHLDNVIHNSSYRIITLIIAILIALVLVYFYIRLTGRTFNIYDKLKIIIGGLISGTALYFLFYYIDAYIVLLPLKLIKEKENEKQKDFWLKMNELEVDKKNFYNNLNYELQDFFYNSKYEQRKNIIDYDIVDYSNFKYTIDKDNKLHVSVKLEMRVTSINNNKINTKNEIKTFTLVRNNIKNKKDSKTINIINCHSCGAPIDLTEKECSYCHNKNNYLQEWYLDEVEK